MFVEYDKFNPDKLFLIPTGRKRNPYRIGYKYEEKEGPLFVKGPTLKTKKGVEYIRKPHDIASIIMTEIPGEFLLFWENLHTTVLKLCKANGLDISLKYPINIPEDETRTIYKVFDVILYKNPRFYMENGDDYKQFNSQDMNNVTMSFSPYILFDDLVCLDNKGVITYHIDSAEVISIEKNKLFPRVDESDVELLFGELKLYSDNMEKY